MKKFLFAVLSLTLFVVSFYMVASADTNQFQACVASGAFSADACATCFDPSRGTGSSGSSQDCLCKTQLAELGEAAFNAQYGSFGGCIQVEHSAIPPVL